MDTSLSLPLSLLAAIGIVSALRLLIRGFRRKDGSRLFLVTSGILILPPSVFLLLALNPWLIDPRFRTFRDFYYDVEHGMTRAEVSELLDRHYPADGERGKPTVHQGTEELTYYFMNTEGQGPSCEGVFIRYNQGIVVGRSYSND